MTPDVAEEDHAFKARIPQAVWHNLRMYAYVELRSINSVIVESLERLLDERTTRASFRAMLAEVAEESAETLRGLGDR